jgi:hypothetical protein
MTSAPICEVGAILLPSKLRNLMHHTITHQSAHCVIAWEIGICQVRLGSFANKTTRYLLMRFSNLKMFLQYKVSLQYALNCDMSENVLSYNCFEIV